jgi:hypothetical protein
VIDYGSFQFAAPIDPGVRWFVYAAREAGLNDARPLDALKPFPESYNGTIRVSLVRHPINFLYAHYLISQDGSQWEDWIMRVPPGFVTNQYARYRADSYIRIEDCPEAFASLLKIIGIDPEKLDRPFLREKPALPRAPLNPTLHKRILESEREVFTRFDYW